RNGRVRGGPGARTDTSALPGEVRALLSGQDVTLLQLSTTFCAPCRQARVLLSDLARNTAGLAHVELDLTERPELASRLHVLRTPTTLALDTEGNELLRVGGVPRRAELLDALRGSRSIP
ncbi:MAG: TlpA family protein disulfide reductase, partial [Sciscionella sp.]